MKSRLYTRTGDDGTTSLVGGTRAPKDSFRLEAYGTTDELNSWLGLLAASEVISDVRRSQLLDIQNTLFDIGAARHRARIAMATRTAWRRDRRTTRKSHRRNRRKPARTATIHTAGRTPRRSPRQHSPHRGPTRRTPHNSPEPPRESRPRHNPIHQPPERLPVCTGKRNKYQQPTKRNFLAKTLTV